MRHRDTRKLSSSLALHNTCNTTPEINRQNKEMKKLVSKILAGVLVMTSVISLSEGAIEADSSSFNSNPSCPVVQIHYPNAQTVNRECPSPYTNILGECFYIHMYEPSFNWQEAKTFCKQAGGKLAEPKHFGAIVAHLYNIPDVANRIFSGTLNRLWLGGNRTASGTGHPFKWLSGRLIEDPVEAEEEVFGATAGDCVMLFMRSGMPFYLRGNDFAERIFRSILKRLWLGGNRSGIGHPFKWLSGGLIEDPVEAEETTFSSSPGDCVMILIKLDMPFYLRGNDCNASVYFICQLP